MLKKLLFISLLFSATMPSEAQETSYNWNSWRNRAVEVKNKTANLLSTSGRNALIFLTKNSIEMSLVRVVILSMPYCYFKCSTGRELLFSSMVYLITVNIASAIIERALDWRDRYFMDAINSNNIAKAKRALQWGADINKKDWCDV